MLDIFSLMNNATGSLGEHLVKAFASLVSDGLVLHDVLIDGNQEHKSQIDLVVVGKKGVYVVEVKTFSEAKIYGDYSRSKWYYYSYGRKYDIYSPIRQNQKHIEYMKAFLKDFGEISFFSIIVMICEDFKLSGMLPDKTIVCNSIPAMKRGFIKITESNENIMDDKKKQEIYEFIKNNQYKGKTVRNEHKKDVIEYKKSLDKIKDEKKCPYCKEYLLLRNGKYGSFWGCPNYPKCKYTCK